MQNNAVKRASPTRSGGGGELRHQREGAALMPQRQVRGGGDLRENNGGDGGVAFPAFRLPT
jgi:hypothetical protein